MATKEEVAVEIKDDSNKVTAGTLYFTSFNKADRTRRAITIWVLCWVGAVVSIPIILIHYILIPAFLIAGPVLARAKLKQSIEMEKVEGHCPHHDGPFSLKMEKTDTLPKWAYCPECDKGIQIIDKVEETEAA